MVNERSATNRKDRYLQFWREFKRFADNRYPKLGVRQPRPSNCLDHSIGRTDTYLRLSIHPDANALKCRVHMRKADADRVYEALKSHKQKIRSELDIEEPVRFKPRDEDGGVSRIETVRDFNLEDQSGWGEAISWLTHVVKTLDTVLPPLWRHVG